MADTITGCVEEEYSFCVSHLWRRLQGWRALLMYFRGPGDVPFFIVPILSLLGLWRFTRPPRRLADQDLSAFSGAVVTRTSAYLGTYGMGGPGFVGIHVRCPSGSRLWIVFTIWAAAGWLTLDASLLEDGYFPDERGDSSKTFLPLSALVGARLDWIRLAFDAAELSFTERHTPRFVLSTRFKSFADASRFQETKAIATNRGFA